jgi:hypothetical protein
MKRVLFTVLWFFAIYIGALGVGGGVAGVLTKPASDQPPSISEGYARGQAAGREFGQRFGGIILLGALAASIAGGAMGILPGTRRRKTGESV